MRSLHVFPFLANSVIYTKIFFLAALLNDFDFDSAVLAAAFVGVVACLRLFVAGADALDDAGFFDAVLNEEALEKNRTLFAEL